MVQTLYAIVALMAVMVLAVNMNRSIHGSDQRMMFNEIAAVVTSIGGEILDEIEKYEYDPSALSTSSSAALGNRNALMDPEDFGQNSPCNPDAGFNGCLVINDFHGKTATREVTRMQMGQEFTVTYTVSDIEVIYVDEEPPHAPTNDKTFAKQVTVTVTSPELSFGSGGTPLEFRMSRLYTYPNL